MFATARQKLESPVEATARKEVPLSGSFSRKPEVETGNHWSILVDRIQKGEETALEELYRIFSKGIRYYLCRQLGNQELDDRVHDTFLIVVQAIRRGELREPERLMGFVRTIVRRQVAASIGDAIQSRKGQLDIEEGEGVADAQNNPEQAAIVRQNMEIARTALKSISERDREILTRFYILEQNQKTICTEMCLSDTQFRLLKSRAKARFGEFGKRTVTRNRIAAFFLRKKRYAGH